MKSVSVNQSEPECARVVLLLQCTKLKSELKGTRILRVRHQSTQKCTQVRNCRQECTKVPKIVPRLGPMDTLLGKKSTQNVLECTREQVCLLVQLLLLLLQLLLLLLLLMLLLLQLLLLLLLLQLLLMLLQCKSAGLSLTTHTSNLHNRGSHRIHLFLTRITTETRNTTNTPEKYNKYIKSSFCSVWFSLINFGAFWSRSVLFGAFGFDLVLW